MNDLKSMAKDAKKRLKTGFWEEHKDGINLIKTQAKSQGIESSNIVRYYQTTVIKEVKHKKDETELFYTFCTKSIDFFRYYIYNNLWHK